ncbi:hypothetical protein [Pseudomonas coronafaciens]|uniref:hypothetical protein n=1 Tax=Pseudomonas coronafaciens TaxID=53409 RepID=UPI001F19586B|nr:hypothetical protein [Pseudomonas coronafaciens]
MQAMFTEHCIQAIAKGSGQRWACWTGCLGSVKLYALNPRRRIQEFEGGLLTVPARDYYGLYKYSPKKAWAISWKDSTPDGRRGGHREEGEGRYVLIDVANNAVLVDARMPRPNNGAVADNGSFCLEDWHFGSALSGTFHVFTSSLLRVYR